MVELDTSESVLALDKLRSDLQVKENEQSQQRLALRTSLADVDGKIALKQLEVESAESRVTGDKTLLAEGLLSRDAFRRSELALTQARVELEQLRESRANAEASTKVALDTLTLERGTLDKEASQARRLVELSTTKSDRAGVVTWALSQEGGLVRKGDVIARLADLSSYRVDATVSDVHAGRLRTGMPAVVLINEQPLAGTVANVFPTVENGVVRFSVALDDAGAGRPAPEPARRRPRRHRPQGADPARRPRPVRRRRLAPRPSSCAATARSACRSSSACRASTRSRSFPARWRATS